MSLSSLISLRSLAGWQIIAEHRVNDAGVLATLNGQ
ncbi:flagellar motor protein [marine gamma proteobacterium HTCC2143]|uniref:Flagellar motor protein n=1 Tax=marine gamma proteobacterium HTCC2143 TaxID=247633 RepID=A0Y7G3_9GAMM|nr:flagellar motor protein [marine gamma proteobacterium HTCC2143]